MNYRFKSLPATLVLVLPRMTPSGLSIGIMKKFTTALSYYASLVSESRNLMKPLSICELLVSPGCTRPVIITFFFFRSVF